MIVRMASRDIRADESPVYGPWNPGIQSQVPKELRHLATIFRGDNVFTSIATADELQGLTGIPPSELIAFRPQRLALHELLIRVTADFAVPDGSRIGDLGINFREIANRLLERYLIPEMAAITAAYERTRSELRLAIHGALAEVVPPLPAPPASGRRGRRSCWRASAPRRAPAAAAPADPGWGPRHLAECERLAGIAATPQQRIAYRKLARVMSALFATQGHAWGTHDLIVSMATDMACNDFGSECIGRAIEPLLLHAARSEGYNLLPRQEHPVVINTKGPSASGKSTLRPLQKKLAGEIGVRWSDFALISPDIWRKQLLDYGSLGAAYKYAGAFTAEELQIVDQKLDRYMARKHQRGEMTHLLIDRFRFDSFAPDSDEAGSNLLTRFGQTVYLFFMITPPELLVERAWKRGLEFGRYKAVDDTLAHAVEAYTGIPDVFFTWVRHSDKRIQFEFLDNTVPFGDAPADRGVRRQRHLQYSGRQGNAGHRALRTHRCRCRCARSPLPGPQPARGGAQQRIPAALHRRISRDQFRRPDQRPNLSSHRMRQCRSGRIEPCCKRRFRIPIRWSGLRRSRRVRCAAKFRVRASRNIFAHEDGGAAPTLGSWGTATRHSGRGA